MPKKIYYGDFRNKRKNDGKKRFIIILSVIVIMGVIVWLTVFFGATGQKDVANAVKGSVQEITQLKLQIKERDDKIAQLEAKISDYETELALRPTIPPMVIEPPNPAVLSGQPTPTPTPKPTRKSERTSQSGRQNNSNNNASNNTPVSKEPENNTSNNAPVNNTPLSGAANAAAENGIHRLNDSAVNAGGTDISAESGNSDQASSNSVNSSERVSVSPASE